MIFDTDAADRRLRAFFPEALVVDLERVPDQMRLFDTLTAPVAKSQVIDLTHRSFRKFFMLVRDIDYVREAKARGIEPVIFYIPDWEADSYREGKMTRDSFLECAFVLAENAALGEPSREARQSSGFAAFETHEPRMVLPRLDPFFAGAIEDPRLSLSEFARRAQRKEAPPPLPPERMSIAYLSLETRAGIAVWLKVAFAEIERVLWEAEAQAELPRGRLGA